MDSLLKRLCILLFFFVTGIYSVSARSEAVADVRQYTYKIVKEFPHDQEAFTQGLTIDNGNLYEGTGGYGDSSLRRVDMQTGKILQKHRLPSSLFGEGITVVGDSVIQLTWRAQFGLVYDKHTFKVLRVFKYPGEGWGITYDGNNLIMSDGTATLRYLDLDTFKEVKRVQVTNNNRPVAFLNELEFVKGLIYANIWKSDRIAFIDPGTGSVEGWLDLTGLLSSKLKNEKKADVLNGIAYDSDNDSLFVTGKLWPTVFQIEPVPLQKDDH